MTTMQQMLQEFHDYAYAQNVMDKYFSIDGVTPVKTGKKGRPVVRQISDASNDYLSPLPSGLVAEISEKPKLIANVLNILAFNRRQLTSEEQEYIINSRDAKVMGMLDGEPTQVDYFVRYSVERKKNQTIGQAFLEKVQRIIKRTEEDATELNRTLYVIVQRYAVSRDMRNILEAEEFDAPKSGIGLMSNNNVSIIVTDNAEKHYKGEIALVATCTPSFEEYYEGESIEQEVYV